MFIVKSRVGGYKFNAGSLPNIYINLYHPANCDTIVAEQTNGKTQVLIQKTKI